MVADHPVVRPHPSDAGLSFIVPGLGQLRQRRFGPAAYFALEMAVLVGVFAFSAPSRSLVFAGICALTVWSMLDAYRARPAR